MESGGQSGRSLERSTSRLADFVGIVIALLTLTLPLAVIAYYSSSAEPLPPANQLLQPSGSRTVQSQ